ncbi:LysR family transcriptional regulator [Halioxenophilus sp. WMMB6]|uniref:LysR family transcriptional regulator n=1 Tax=Halioxenophilus sp. WMMB6 TaxID=3073815 RepID=UPI00295EBF91|nr:LysR family transcriptional regulator [Halioxenophilus sp. WMMB6]
MRLDKIDLNLFVVFDAIYRERNITRVAASLNITQPAVSNALARLRQTLDDPLFVRTPQGMSPTPVADNLVGDVRAALALLDRSLSTTARFEPHSSEKTFNLGMNDLGEALLLPHLQQAIARVAPKMSLTCYYLNRQLASEELRKGTIDLLLDIPAVNAKELAFEAIASLDYVVAMRKQHPLVKKKTFSLKEYLSQDHLHVSSRRSGRGQMDIALNALGHRRRIALRIQNYLVAARVVADSDLLWTVPRALAETLPLHTKKMPFTMEPLMWNLYWHKNADNDPANQWLRALILERAATELSGD